MARSAPTFLETLYRDLREAHEDYHKAYADQNWEYARYLRDDYIPKISGILGEHWRDLQDSKLLFDEITVEAKTFFLLFYYVLVRVQFSEQQTEIIHEGHLYNEPLQIVPNRVERVNDFFHSPGSPKLVKFRLLCENVYKAQEQKSEISRKLEAFRWKLFDCQREIFGSEPRTFAPLPPIPETIPPLIIINGQPRNAIRNPARLLEYKTPLWDFKTLRLIDHFGQLHVILELSPEQIAYFEPRRETWHTPIYEYAP